VSDERFEEMLRRAARDYRAPGATPRDEMWAAIERARRARHPAAPARRPLAGVAAAAGIAAVLALGVAIGRWTADSGPPPSTLGVGLPAGSVAAPALAPQLDTAVLPAEPARAVAVAESDRAAGMASPDAAPRVAMPDDGAPAERRRRAATVEPSRQLVATAPPVLTRTTPARRPAGGAATARHLAEVEVLLTAFRADARAGAVDRDVADWARDLLGTTRLLLDSPAGDDARLRRLLGDLEVVLAQMARLPGRPAAGDEVQIIDEAVRQRDVIARVRSALPAGVRAGS
jgi:hypothetical protein